MLDRKGDQLVVPVYKILSPVEGIELFRPTKNDHESAILSIIKDIVAANHGSIVLNSGSHQLVKTNNPSPHHKDGSFLFWVISQMSNGAIQPWQGDASWQALTEDDFFVDGMEQQLVGINEDYETYLLLGFAPPGLIVPEAFNRGLQSQARGHAHATPRIPMQADRNLDHSDPEDFEHLKWLMNYAGERSIDLLQGRLIGFGEKLICTLTMKTLDGEDVNIVRTAHGFKSFKEALRNVINLKNALTTIWADHVLNLATTYQVAAPAFIMAVGEVIDGIKQCPVPSFAFIFPSQSDRERCHVNDNNPVWVFPFAVCGPAELLYGRVLIREGAPQMLSQHRE